MSRYVDHNGSLMYPGRIQVDDVPAQQRRAAVRFVASASHHADDAQLLLSALGLTAQEGKTR